VIGVRKLWRIAMVLGSALMFILSAVGNVEWW